MQEILYGYLHTENVFKVASPCNLFLFILSAPLLNVLGQEPLGDAQELMEIINFCKMYPEECSEKRMVKVFDRVTKSLNKLNFLNALVGTQTDKKQTTNGEEVKVRHKRNLSLIAMVRVRLEARKKSKNSLLPGFESSIRIYGGFELGDQ